MNWTGIEFDTLRMEAWMPKCKINDTLNPAKARLDRIIATLSQLRSLLGKLFHIVKCCKSPHLQLVVACMLNTLRQAPPPLHFIVCLDFVHILNKITDISVTEFEMNYEIKCRICNNFILLNTKS